MSIVINNLLAHKQDQDFAQINANRHGDENQELMMLLKFVVNVARNMLPISTKKQNTVQYVKIKSVKSIGKADVYNMEVKNHHNFSVCGGFIIHNCMDAVRYFAYTIVRRERKWS